MTRKALHLRRKTCRVHRVPLTLSLAGVPHCRRCERDAAREATWFTRQLVQQTEHEERVTVE